MLFLGLWVVVKPQSCPSAFSLRFSGRDTALMFLTLAGPWALYELLLVPHSSTGCSVERCDSWLALTLFCCY